MTPDDVKAVAVPALAHRLVAEAGALGAAPSGEDVVRETLAAVPTPAAEDVARGTMRPFAFVAAASYIGLAALGLIAALALRRAELVIVAAPFALVVAAGLLFEGRPDVRAWLSVDHERALEGDEISAVIDVSARTTIDLLELNLLSRGGSRSSTATTRSGCA